MRDGNRRLGRTVPVAVAGGRSVLLFVVLDLGELGVHHVLCLRAALLAIRAGSACVTRLPGGRGRGG